VWAGDLLPPFLPSPTPHAPPARPVGGGESGGNPGLLAAALRTQALSRGCQDRQHTAAVRGACVRVCVCASRHVAVNGVFRMMFPRAPLPLPLSRPPAPAACAGLCCRCVGEAGTATRATPHHHHAAAPAAPHHHHHHHHRHPDAGAQLEDASHSLLRGMRIGVPRGPFFADLDPALAAVVEAALSRLRRAGALLIEVDFGPTQRLSRRASRGQQQQRRRSSSSTGVPSPRAEAATRPRLV